MSVYRTKDMPAPFRSYYRRRRAKRTALAGGVGLAALLGTKRGRGWARAGLKRLPKAYRKRVGRGVAFGIGASRRASQWATPRFMSGYSRFVQSKTGSWLLPKVQRALKWAKWL